MNTYRVTYPLRYPATSPGFSDASARQGYYVKASGLAEAKAIARELGDGEPFNIEFWKEG